MALTSLHVPCGIFLARFSLRCLYIQPVLFALKGISHAKYGKNLLIMPVYFFRITGPDPKFGVRPHHFILFIYLFIYFLLFPNETAFGKF